MNPKQNCEKQSHVLSQSQQNGSRSSAFPILIVGLDLVYHIISRSQTFKIIHHHLNEQSNKYLLHIATNTVTLLVA